MTAVTSDMIKAQTLIMTLTDHHHVHRDDDHGDHHDHHRDDHHDDHYDQGHDHDDHDDHHLHVHDHDHDHHGLIGFRALGGPPSLVPRPNLPSRALP